MTDAGCWILDAGCWILDDLKSEFYIFNKNEQQPKLFPRLHSEKVAPLGQ